MMVLLGLDMDNFEDSLRRIITSGFSKVIWGEQYRCDSGLQLLREVGISEYQLIERV